MRLQKLERKVKNNARHAKQRQDPINKLIHANAIKDRRQTLEYKEKRCSPEFRAARRIQSLGQRKQSDKRLIVHDQK